MHTHIHTLCYIFLLSSVSCATNTEKCPSDSHTVDNMCFVMPNEYLAFPEQEILKAMDILQDELNKHYPDIPEISTIFKESKPVVRFTQKHIATDCVEYDAHWECKRSGIGGAAYEQGNVVVFWEHCFADSSFVHEIMHMIEYRWFGNAPEDHSRKHFFSTKSGSDSIEYKVWRRLAHYIGRPRCL